MTPYWTGSTPKRRSAPVSEGPSGALGATEITRQRDAALAEVERLRRPEHLTEVAIKLAAASAYTLDEVARTLGLYAEIERLRAALRDSEVTR